MPISFESSSGAAVAWTAGLGVLLVIALFEGFRATRGTTLVGAWGWAAIASAALVTVELAAAFDGLGTSIHVARYLAAIFSTAPIIAVLGAKRPQHRAWQFIVGTLMVVLALPAAQTFVLNPGADVHLHSMVAVLLLAILVIEIANYLPTRYALCAVLAVAGQAVLVIPYIPWTSGSTFRNSPIVGLTLVAIGTFGASMQHRVRRQRHGWNRAWLDFRDLYGLAWSMRVLERFNSESRSRGESTRLRWSGLTADAGLETRRLQALLSLFVSKAWLTERVDES